MQKQGIARHVCRSAELLRVSRSKVLLGRCAEAKYCWQVCRISVLLGKCAEAGYCSESEQKRVIAGQVCRSKVLLVNYAEEGYC